MLSKTVLLLPIILLVHLKNNSLTPPYETNDSTKNSITISKIDNNLKLISNNQVFETDSFLILARKTLYLANSISYKKGIYESYYNIGHIYRHRLFNDSAVFYFEKGIDQDITDYDDIAKFYWHISNTYRLTGDYSSALRYSINLKELIESNKTNRFRYQIYNALALNYQTLMEYELAKTNFKLSAQLDLENNDEAYAGIIYANLGKLLFDQDSLYKALEYFEKGVQLEEKHQLMGSAGNSYTHIAEIYMKQNNPDTARHFLLKATEYNRMSNNKIGLTNTLFIVSKYYDLINDHKRALDHLKLTIDYATQTNLRSILSQAYHLRSQIYADQGKFNLAYDDFNSFYKIHNTIYDVEKINNAKAVEQKLIQQQRENELVALKLKKQKTISSLLYIIVILVIIAGIVIVVYLFKFKNLTKELINSKEKAEESDKLKSKFLQTISHEIRTPLNGIIGFSEMLLSDNLSKKELIQLNDMILKNSDDLISTIENLVDVAHISTNQFPSRKTNFNLTSLLESIVYQAEHNIIFKNKTDLKIRLERNGEININTDKTAVLKIVNHLVKNAILYTENGLITIGYKIDHKEIIIYVKDTGIGISQDKIDIIFSPFRQADENINIKVGGTGLGLTIVNNFVQMIGGRIWVGSEINKGSIFYFSIPLD